MRPRSSTKPRVVALSMALLGPGAAWAEAPAGTLPLSGWQEITVLTIAKLEHATANCGFQLGWKQVSVLLDTAGLTLDQVHHLARSSALQQQIDEDAAGYRADRVRACAQAWASFGADADARDYLIR
jgi:hypothetical protein